MHKDIRRDYLQGQADLRKALPILQKHCPEFGAGRYTLVGEHSGSIANDLDMLDGFDIYQHWRTGMRGIAGRAQRCEKPFRTFSIRTGRASGAETEYKKRLQAIRHKLEGMMYPYWTMHAYLTMDGSQVQAIGLAKTEELFTWIYQREKSGYPFMRIPAGRETFLAVGWDLYRGSGCYFYEYSPVVAEQPLKGKVS